jgi:hypothetical protein
MLSRISQVAALCGLLVASGCASLSCGDGCSGKSPYAGKKYEQCCETCGSNGCWGGCGSGNCSCGSSCGCGDNVACGGQCDGSCGGSCGCGNGGDGCCSGCTVPGGPCVRLLRRIGSKLDCAGCGECYWNEWYNDPPSCAEPCDCCGNYIGPGHACTCCSAKPYYSRTPYACGCGCPSCGGSCSTGCGPADCAANSHQPAEPLVAERTNGVDAEELFSK